jgi:drug/metabolite transporter (DMT)-like permease
VVETAAVADLALLVLTLLWGTTFTLVKDVLAVAPPAVFLAARFGVATLLLGAVWAVRRDRPSPRLWRDGVLLGLAMLTGFALQTLGLRLTTPARSGFITGLSVLIVPFLARFAFGRQVRAAAWLGVALAVTGLAVLTRPFSDAVGQAIRAGDLLTLGCAVAFAGQIILTSEWSARHPLVPFVSLQVGTTLAGALLAIPLEGARLDPGALPQFAGVVAFTGIAMTALAFFVMNWGQRHTTAVRAALIFSLEPVAAALFSYFYGGEPLGLAEVLGGTLVVLGVIAGEVGGALEARTVAEVR